MSGRRAKALKRAYLEAHGRAPAGVVIEWAGEQEVEYRFSEWRKLKGESRRRVSRGLSALFRQVRATEARRLRRGKARERVRTMYRARARAVHQARQDEA